jgi:hypothetical protein
LQLEIDRLGVTILERIVEGLIEVLDRAGCDPDLEDGGDGEPDADEDRCAFCWSGDAKGRAITLAAKRLRRQPTRTLRG